MVCDLIFSDAGPAVAHLHGEQPSSKPHQSVSSRSFRHDGSISDELAVDDVTLWRTGWEEYKEQREAVRSELRVIIISLTFGFPAVAIISIVAQHVVEMQGCMGLQQEGPVFWPVYMPHCLQMCVKRSSSFGLPR